MAHEAHDCGSSAMLRAFASDGEVRRIREVEADLIRLAISRYNGNCTVAAQRLGVSRGTLYRKMDEMGIARAVPDGVEGLIRRHELKSNCGAPGTPDRDRTPRA